MSGMGMDGVRRRTRRQGRWRPVFATLLLLSAVASSGVAHAQSTGPGEADPDTLYANREVLADANRAAGIWEQRLVDNPRDFEAAWKLSRARYWLGGMVEPADQQMHYEAGMAVARRAVAMEPDRPEGHFWMAANMGALAESFGLRAGLRYRGAIKDRLETALRLDPAYQQGSADRALGRWYMMVPRLLGEAWTGPSNICSAHSNSTRSAPRRSSFSQKPTSRVSNWSRRGRRSIG